MRSPSERKFFELVETIKQFQLETFLKDIEPPYDQTGLLNHLNREIDEVKKNPDDITEWIDCLILVLGGILRQFPDSDAEFILNELSFKMMINLKRKWKEPDEQGVISHIEEPHFTHLYGAGELKPEEKPTDCGYDIIFYQMDGSRTLTPCPYIKDTYINSIVCQMCHSYRGRYQEGSHFAIKCSYNRDMEKNK